MDYRSPHLALLVVYWLVYSGCVVTGHLQNECVEKGIDEEYDFIVVGGGSAGATVAHRLSENPHWKVLLLEAGGDAPLASEIPFLAPTLQQTPIDWKFKLQPQNTACLAMKNRQCLYARGKCLGGSSVINYNIYFRGNHRDYDYWESLGNPGWCYKDVLPYFIKCEGNKHIGSPYHGKNGLLSVNFLNYYTPLANTLVEAGYYFNYSSVDLNSQSESGFMLIQGTVEGGFRCSTNKAFLKTAACRQNLYIRTSAHVTKVLIDPKANVAYGVKYISNGAEYTVRAAKEVILSAGSINSPHLLMLSGVGPAKHLQKIGIPVKKDLRGVGKNIQDHIAFAGLCFLVNENITVQIDRTLGNPLNYMEFINTQTGPLSNNAAEALGTIYTKFADPRTDLPDIEMLLFSTTPADTHELYLTNVLGLKRDVIDRYFKFLTGKEVFCFSPILLRPYSRGYLELKSSNPLDHPLLHANFLTHPHDVAVAVEGIKFGVQLGLSQPFQRFGSKLYDKHFPGCEYYEFGTDEYWECCLRHLTVHFWHFAGSCKMGPCSDPMAVVNHKLKVHGVDRLRVVDTSIMPRIVGGHTNAAAIMIGEKAADDIKMDHRIPSRFG